MTADPQPRIKVLLVWPSLGYAGGVTTYLAQCLHKLPAFGLAPGVLVPDPPVRAYRGRFSVEDPAVLRMPYRFFDGDSSFQARLRRALARLRPDVVVLNEWQAAEDVLRALPAGVPVVNICHVDRPDDTYYRRAVELAPELACIACVSRRIAGRVRELLPEPFSPLVRYLPLGVEIPPPREQAAVAAEPDGPIRLAYVGRLDQVQKRIRDAVPFVRALDRLGVPFHFTLLGEGGERAFLQRELEGDLRAGRVTLLPTAGHDEAMRVLSAQDVLLLFSDYEGLPLVLLEAMVRQVVPVVTRVESGVMEIVRDGVNARLFAPGRPDQAAAIVAELYQEPQRLRRLARGAAEVRERFDIDRCMGDYVRLYRELAGPRGQGTRYENPRSRLPRDLSVKEKLWTWLPRDVIRRLGTRTPNFQ